jgi:hypothetical protein
VHADGVLVYDGVGQAQASTGSKIYLGDSTVTSGADSQFEIHSFQYYDGGDLPFECAAMEVSELALWGADQSAYLADLWNSGTQQSVATACGLSGQVPAKSSLTQRRRGATSTPALTTDLALVPEMEAFMLTPGGEVSLHTDARVRQTTSGQQVYGAHFVNGQGILDVYGASFHSDGTITNGMLNQTCLVPVLSGLQYMEFRAAETGGVGTVRETDREFIAEVKQ